MWYGNSEIIQITSSRQNVIDSHNIFVSKIGLSCQYNHNRYLLTQLVPSLKCLIEHWHVNRPEPEHTESVAVHCATLAQVCPSALSGNNQRI